ncbi:MAG: deaminase, partial [Bacteroidota bacterium]
MIDEKYMRLSFQLAKKGEGFVSPNPFVGCVIVKEEKIIAAGFHEKYGALHAERNAILNSTEDFFGATLYCNLEPCMHTDKQTPPCVPLIISSGIKRV